MSLKTYINNLEEVPESLHDYYHEDGDGFRLDLEGQQDRNELKNKLGEFRNNNKALKEQLEAYQARFAELEEVDPAEIKKAMKAHKEAKDKQMLPASEVDRLLKERLTEAQSKSQKELEEAKSLASQLSMQMSQMMIEKNITEAVQQVGQLQKGALSDVLHRAKIEMDWVDGGLVERSTGLSVEATNWAETLFKNSPFFFQPNTGVGSRGSSKGSNTPNPFMAGDTFNLTEQGRLIRENPNEAMKMAREAGVELMQ